MRSRTTTLTILVDLVLAVVFVVAIGAALADAGGTISARGDVNRSDVAATASRAVVHHYNAPDPSIESMVLGSTDHRLELLQANYSVALHHPSPKRRLALTFADLLALVSALVVARELRRWVRRTVAGDPQADDRLRTAGWLLFVLVPAALGVRGLVVGDLLDDRGVVGTMLPPIFSTLWLAPGLVVLLLHAVLRAKPSDVERAT